MDGPTEDETPARALQRKCTGVSNRNSHDVKKYDSTSDTRPQHLLELSQMLGRRLGPDKVRHCLLETDDGLTIEHLAIEETVITTEHHKDYTETYIK